MATPNKASQTWSWETVFFFPPKLFLSLSLALSFFLPQTHTLSHSLSLFIDIYLQYTTTPRMCVCAYSCVVYILATKGRWGRCEMIDGGKHFCILQFCNRTLLHILNLNGATKKKKNETYWCIWGGTRSVIQRQKK